MSHEMDKVNQPTPGQQMFTKSIQETQEANKDLEAMLTANKADASLDALKAEAEDTSALGIMIKTQKLVKKQELKTDKVKHAQKSVLVRKDDADGLADQFSRKDGNREYRIDSKLLAVLAAEELGEGITPESNTDAIIETIRRRMSVNGILPDVAIVDKTFEFLMEVMTSQVKTASEIDKPRMKGILSKLEAAKNQHFEAHAVEIQVAQKIIGAVDAVVETTGQTVKETLDRYRDVVHNPPDLQTLRKFYEGKGHKAMVLELKGLSSYLGGNLKRANLENPEIAQLASAARKMQALLGVFRQAKSRIPTMENFLKLNDIVK